MRKANLNAIFDIPNSACESIIIIAGKMKEDPKDSDFSDALGGLIDFVKLMMNTKVETIKIPEHHRPAYLTVVSVIDPELALLYTTMKLLGM